MQAQELLSLRPTLDRFLTEFDDCAVAPTREHIGTYVRGQLGPLPRKSIEPIALDANVPPRTLQELLSIHRWSEEAMDADLHRRIARTHSGRHVIGIIDDTGCAKKGKKTPGVQRQWCGSTGKTDNCVDLVHLNVADGDFHAMVASELFLPESWASNRARCRAAGIPDEMKYRPKWQIALELIDRAMSQELKFGWIGFDEWYGSKPPFLQGLLDRDLRYVGEVHKAFTGWQKAPAVRLAQEEPPVDLARKFPRVADGTPAAQRVEDIAAVIPAAQHQTYHVKDTHKGPVVWHVSWTSFHPNFDDLPGPRHWLIKAVNAQDATEIKYFISNAASGVPLEVLMHVAFSRWHVERGFEDAKGEIGFDHFEVRNYRSLNRHLILSAVSFLFLAETNEKLRGGKSGVDGLPGEDGRRSPTGSRTFAASAAEAPDQASPDHHALAKP